MLRKCSTILLILGMKDSNDWSGLMATLWIFWGWRYWCHTAKRKYVAGLTSCIFHRKYQATVLQMQWKTKNNRNHLQISLMKYMQLHVVWTIVVGCWKNIRVLCFRPHHITSYQIPHNPNTQPSQLFRRHTRSAVKPKPRRVWIGLVVWDSKGALK